MERVKGSQCLKWGVIEVGPIGQIDSKFHIESRLHLLEYQNHVIVNLMKKFS